jgi:hypothetical protein
LVVGGEAWKMELDSGAVMETMEWNGWPWRGTCVWHY